MTNNRDFKGVWIPKEVWLDKSLTVMEKLFLVEIDSLDNDNGCFASNGHFSDFFGISKGRCTQIIKSLEAKNLIKIQLVRENKTIKKRIIKVVNKLNRVVNKLNTLPSKTKQGYLENDEGSNTLSNNTIISNIVDLYNSICIDCSKCTVLSKPRENAIRARIKETKSQDNIEFWESFFNRVNNSDFLSGRKTDFKANFDWVIKSSNFIKIMEGNYDNREQQSTNQLTDKQEIARQLSDPKYALDNW